MFELSPHEFKILMRIIIFHASHLEKVVLFGSRARGDAKLHSDIDLAIVYNADNKNQTEAALTNAFEASFLPCAVDLLDLSLEKNNKINEFIQQDGVVLYDQNKKNVGEHWMTVAIMNEKLADFKLALTRLDEALQKDINTDSLYLDAIIQRFEFTYELSWKLMKSYLQYLGIDTNNPRATIREAVGQHLIQNADGWFQMIEKRNMTTHTYHKAIAIEVYAAIQSTFIALFHQLEKTIFPLVSELTKKPRQR